MMLLLTKIIQIISSTHVLVLILLNIIALEFFSQEKMSDRILHNAIGLFLRTLLIQNEVTDYLYTSTFLNWGIAMK